MTGTSIDGDLDVAAVVVRGRGLSMRAEVVAHRAHPLGALAEDLRRAARQEPMPAREFARIARAFGEAHATALGDLCADPLVRARADAVMPDGAALPDLAVLHGQTVFHAPPLTWQLVDPWPTAIRLGCRVRHDLRGANAASGGEAAPITPLADFILFGDDRASRIVLNLGGFVNATFVPRRSDGVDAVRGFDACACNHVLDEVARTRLGAPCDLDGAAAARGRCDEAVASRIADALVPVESGSRARRSLGTGDEAARLVGLAAGLAADDACRTVTEAVAEAVSRALRLHGVAEADEVLVAGGSARHVALREAIARRTGAAVASTAALGVDPQAREAAEMAILGALADDGVRFCLPQVVGAASDALDSALVAPSAARRTSAPGSASAPEIPAL